ncbi:MAG: substrate-binding domain-containing protein, partial [Anaerococcus sp.]|nr:substrate-binding domain-containing protein [Anaerococcus sp.]
MKIKNSKIIVAALSLSMILSACGNKDDKANDASGSNPTENASTANEKKDGDTKEANQEDFDITVVSREDGSGTRGAFIELVGLEEEKDGEKKDTTTDEAVVQNSTNGVMQTVSQDPSSIGYVSLGSVNDNVKKVKVDGAEATEENIESGDYTLQRPFNLA